MTAMLTKLPTGMTDECDLVSPGYGHVLFDREKKAIHIKTESAYSHYEVTLQRAKLPRWELLTATGPSGREGSVFGTIGDSLYLFGGVNGSTHMNDTWRYNTLTSEWTQRANSTAAGRSFGGGGVISGKLYVYGGADASTRFADTHMYDPETDQWTNRSPTGSPSARNAFGSSVCNGKLYIYGGYNGSFLNDFHRYDPVTNAWTQLASGANQAEGVACAAIGDIIYVYSGQNNATTLMRYNTVSDTWLTPLTLDHSRRYHSAVTFEDKFYGFGSVNASDTTISVFDPAVGVPMTQLPISLITGRRAPNMTVHGETIYIFGGWRNAQLSDFYAFRPNSLE